MRLHYGMCIRLRLLLHDCVRSYYICVVYFERLFNLSLVIKAAGPPPTLPSYQDVSPAKYPITGYPAGGDPVTTQVPYDVTLVLVMMLLCCSQLI